MERPPVVAQEATTWLLNKRTVWLCAACAGVCAKCGERPAEKAEVDRYDPDSWRCRKCLPDPKDYEALKVARIVAAGGDRHDIARQFGVKPYQADKILMQCRERWAEKGFPWDVHAEAGVQA